MHRLLAGPGAQEKVEQWVCVHVTVHLGAALQDRLHAAGAGEGIVHGVSTSI